MRSAAGHVDWNREIVSRLDEQIRFAQWGTAIVMERRRRAHVDRALFRNSLARRTLRRWKRYVCLLKQRKGALYKWVSNWERQRAWRKWVHELNMCRRAATRQHLAAWKEVAREEAGRVVIWQRQALEVYQRNTYRKCLARWKQWCGSERRQLEHAQNGLARRVYHKAILRVYFREWSCSNHFRKNACRIVSKIFMRCAFRNMQRAVLYKLQVDDVVTTIRARRLFWHYWNIWRSIVGSRKLEKLDDPVTLQCFNAWAKESRQSNGQRRLLKRSLARIYVAGVVGAFQNWYLFAKQPWATRRNSCMLWDISRAERNYLQPRVWVPRYLPEVAPLTVDVLDPEDEEETDMSDFEMGDEDEMNRYRNKIIARATRARERRERLGMAYLPDVEWDDSEEFASSPVPVMDESSSPLVARMRSCLTILGKHKQETSRPKQNGFDFEYAAVPKPTNYNNNTCGSELSALTNTLHRRLRERNAREKEQAEEKHAMLLKKMDLLYNKENLRGLGRGLAYSPLSHSTMSSHKSALERWQTDGYARHHELMGQIDRGLSIEHLCDMEARVHAGRAYSDFRIKENKGNVSTSAVSITSVEESLCSSSSSESDGYSYSLSGSMISPMSITNQSAPSLTTSRTAAPP